MSFERKEIASGVFLNTIEEHKFKSGRMSVRFMLPLSEETAAKYSLVFPVLRRGSVRFPDIGTIRREEESLYDTEFADSVYKRGDCHVLEFRMRVLHDRYALDGMVITERALDLMTDILFAPVTENGVFLEEYVESEKEKLIDDILSKINDKYLYARQRLVEEMFAGEAYGISELGTVESVSAVTPDALYAAYLAVLKSARVEIFAVGEFDFAALEQRFRALFADIDRADVFCPETSLAARREEVKTVCEAQNISQGKLMLGFTTGVSATDGNYHAMQVLNMIFGGGATSKLFCNVREKMSLCYYCGSTEVAQKGALFVGAGIEPENEKKAAEAILYQLDEMKKGNISDGELSDAKLALMDSVNRIADSAGAILNWHFSGVMNGTLLTPEEKKAKIASVTREDVVRLAENIRLDTYYFLSGKEKA